jgi:superfamily I DNA/RNA helicase
MIAKDEMTESVDAETFQERLWGMFNYQFGEKLSLPQIDRIRWHLFPEIRITSDLFTNTETTESSLEESLPEVIKVMDLKQEQLARSMGEGHRVIHGVAGSGKTLILGYRSLYLANQMQKPILLLCYNVTLAAKLRSMMRDKGLLEQVQVYHFHDWCGEQAKRYHVKLPEYGDDYPDKLVEAVIAGVDKNQIPRAQYGAVLIDEGHDFHPEWLKLVVQMLDPETNSLLLLYDDAQSIYKASRGLDFSLSSVGVQARGRTTILNLNYRNTQQIITLAYLFAKEYINPVDADEDHVPVIKPESGGTNGPAPVYKQMNSLDEELEYIVKCLRHWREAGSRWNEIAILYPAKWLGEKLIARLEQSNIPFCFLVSKSAKMKYNPSLDQVTVLTLHSSKGLEFQTVIMMGIGHIKDAEEVAQQARILYVGMTRAREKLLITSSAKNSYTRKIDESLKYLVN